MFICWKSFSCIEPTISLHLEVFFSFHKLNIFGSTNWSISPIRESNRKIDLNSFKLQLRAEAKFSELSSFCEQKSL